MPVYYGRQENLIKSIRYNGRRILLAYYNGQLVFDARKPIEEIGAGVEEAIVVPEAKLKFWPRAGEDEEGLFPGRAIRIDGGGTLELGTLATPNPPAPIALAKTPEAFPDEVEITSTGATITRPSLGVIDSARATFAFGFVDKGTNQVESSLPYGNALAEGLIADLEFEVLSPIPMTRPARMDLLMQQGFSAFSLTEGAETEVAHGLRGIYPFPQVEELLFNDRNGVGLAMGEPVPRALIYRDFETRFRLRHKTTGLESPWYTIKVDDGHEYHPPVVRATPRDGRTYDAQVAAVPDSVLPPAASVFAAATGEAWKKRLESREHEVTEGAEKLGEFGRAIYTFPDTMDDFNHLIHGIWIPSEIERNFRAAPWKLGTPLAAPAAPAELGELLPGDNNPTQWKVITNAEDTQRYVIGTDPLSVQSTGRYDSALGTILIRLGRVLPRLGGGVFAGPPDSLSNKVHMFQIYREHEFFVREESGGTKHYFYVEFIDIVCPSAGGDNYDSHVTPFYTSHFYATNFLRPHVSGCAMSWHCAWRVGISGPPYDYAAQSLGVDAGVPLFIAWSGGYDRTVHGTTRRIPPSIYLYTQNPINFFYETGGESGGFWTQTFLDLTEQQIRYEDILSGVVVGSGSVSWTIKDIGGAIQWNTRSFIDGEFRTGGSSLLHSPYYNFGILALSPYNFFLGRDASIEPTVTDFSPDHSDPMAFRRFIVSFLPVIRSRFSRRSVPATQRFSITFQGPLRSGVLIRNS